MALRDIHLSTLITTTALIAVVFGAFSLLLIEESRLQNDYLNERRAQINHNLTSETQRLRNVVETLRRDTLFLSNTPPITGIVRASQNGGIDPRENNSNAVWKKRLQEILGAFIQAHPEYYNIRYIGVANGGRELVEVRMGNKGKAEVTPDAGLQSKAEQEYFKLSMELSAGQVALSRFFLDHEQEPVVFPQHPALRAVVPVFDGQGKHFGLLVTHMDMSRVLTSATQEMPFGARTYIANMNGIYLMHPDVTRVFETSQGGIMADFPVTSILYGENAKDELSLQEYSVGKTQQYLAAKRIHFDSAQPARFLVLAYGLPADLIETGITAIPTQHIISGLLLTLLVAGFVFFVLRRMFAPLDQLTAVANAIAGGNYAFKLPPKTGGQIGLLVSAIDSMLSRLLQREQDVLQLNTNLEDRVEQRTDELTVINARLREEIDKRTEAEEALQHENNFRKSLIESLPGIFYMFDTAGRFLMWNRNFWV
ncbi:MAG: HAMP domain-containing protein [Gallionella sp.]|nr:HAMP domain-containing protein [Gallionella sp.]